jgi:hypothetical protein
LRTEKLSLEERRNSLLAKYRIRNKEDEVSMQLEYEKTKKNENLLAC